MFIKYMHIERIGTDEVDGLLDGECWVFPKLDGTNGSIWLEDNQVCAGSRRRQLSLDSDNAGFLAHVLANGKYEEWLREHPNRILYGEWLVPHSLRTYRQDAWRKFYVFDVWDKDEEKWLPYNRYVDSLEEHHIPAIPPMYLVDNPSVEYLTKLLDKNTYLIADGQGAGEGIVVKRYDFVNRYGRTVWGKLVRNEFKEKNHKVFGTPHIELTNIETKIAKQFVTQALVDKVLAKMTLNKPWASRRIPELLNRVWHDLITEEMWNVLKKHRNPTIDFKRLYRHTVARTKELKPELF